jgi:ribonucleotide reductase beta subunit family protein with ferritin-like domain
MCQPIASTTLAFPIDNRYLKFYEIYLRMTNVSWRHTNVISAGDKSAYALVDERVKKLYIPFLKLLNSTDTIVGANWAVTVPERVRQIMFVDLCKRFIEFIEGEHALTYQKFISDFIEDPLVRKELFESNQVYGPVILLDEYARDYIRNEDYGYGLFANMLIEHILLPVIFTFVGWTAEKSLDIVKRVPGFITANTYIQADEKTHVEFAFLILDMFPELVPKNGAHIITKDGERVDADAMTLISRFVDFVDAFLDDAFDGIEVPGITADILKTIARSQANELIRKYASEDAVLYKVGTMPGYMLAANRMKKEAFFETTTAVYSHVESTVWGDISKEVTDI